jgi:hypothetical protein
VKNSCEKNIIFFIFISAANLAGYTHDNSYLEYEETGWTKAELFTHNVLN